MKTEEALSKRLEDLHAQLDVLTLSIAKGYGPEYGPEIRSLARELGDEAGGVTALALVLAQEVEEVEGGECEGL